ncbi:hypothetical protein K502DRAFT_342733 [Neoconidiobolus thromboides FSU 785]|nr:hypothetical protein K502DRAFT_342733 [Neoconidiobolus thromboides FSU 785]
MIKTENQFLSNSNYGEDNEELPSYYEDPTIEFPTTSNLIFYNYEKYKIQRQGFLWRDFNCINQQSLDTRFKIKTKTVSGKLYDNEENKLKIKNIRYFSHKIKWDIEYIGKHSKLYTNLQLVRKSFQLRRHFIIRLTKSDDQIIEYHVINNSNIPISWILYPKEEPSNILLKYESHVFKDSILHVYPNLDVEDLKIFLLVMLFAISYD